MSTTHLLQERANSLTLKEMKDARDSTSADSTGFPYPPDSPVFYIKFGNQPKPFTKMEAQTQQFAYDALQTMRFSDVGNKCVPRIPKILCLLESEHVLYIVMEYVHGSTLLELAKTKTWEEQQPYIKQIAESIDVLLTIPIPPEAAPGPHQGGVIRHPVFKDGEAAKPFNSVLALQDHIDSMVTSPGPAKFRNLPPIKFESTLHFVYSDLYPGNFIYDANGDMWIVDFGHAAFLPLSFQTYALVASFPRSMVYAYTINQLVKTKLPTDNVESMKRAHSHFTLCVFGFRR